MASPDPTKLLMPSILDRLVDPGSGGTLSRRGYTVEQMIHAVRRDLEDLLNTRRTNLDIPDECVELLHSIEAYGIPDLASTNAFTAAQRADIGRVMEKIIAQFEPRLRNVRASLVDDKQPKQPTVRFHIDARLTLDPAPEVAFETVLELTTGHTFIRTSEE